MSAICALSAGVKSEIQPLPEYTRVDCGRPRIYPSLPESTPLYCDHVKCILLPESTPLSQNIPPFPTTNLYATLPESNPPSQNIPPFSQPYATLPESTPPSQNIPLFSQL